ncbi:MAG: MoxR-like ATPase in aerotolerance operon [uncultured Aureispira sp.]|uniref:MoxR-like ATPase in aerotolerance operon n=1 Tax=uncultured Aureispira sp. TaxID=1331704 RepID=A0A6S6SH72_9BACT|nr:MAG: MoxR-like ATPase in aerotolerance operon [uncultured Aureispira sp.]
MQTSADIQLLQEQIALESQVIERLMAETNKVIIGQQYMLERLMIGLLAQGHILLEGLPGLAKTLAINTLSKAIRADFQRIQFTPDLLPADIVGTMIYNQAEKDFTVRKGPIFANFILADEINRAPAKVQSALLEAMQERQVTIGETTYKLQEPFLVLATQNPIEQEGTYPLPEAQTDRFMLKASITYPNKEDERAIMRMNMAGSFEKINPVATIEDILQARQTVRKVHMAESIEQYILDIVFATREPAQYGLSDIAPLISFGGSPRASINMALAAKAHAYLRKRAFVIPEDIRAIAQDVLRHRIGLTYEAQAENVTAEQIVEKILNTIQIP